MSRKFIMNIGSSFIHERLTLVLSCDIQILLLVVFCAGTYLRNHDGVAFFNQKS